MAITQLFGVPSQTYFDGNDTRPPSVRSLTDSPACFRHFIKVTASADASKRGGFAVTVERFIKSSTLFHVGTGRFSETGSATLSTLWNIIFPGARMYAFVLVFATS